MPPSRGDARRARARPRHEEDAMRWDTHGRALSALAFMITVSIPLSAGSRAAGIGTSPPLAARATAPDPTADLDGVVVDSASGVPLAGAEVLLIRDKAIAARTTSHRLGHFHIHNHGDHRHHLEERL